jgi:hypothetical protein
MKSILKIMMFPVAAVLLITGCTKETSEIRLDPALGTTKIFNVTSNSATVTGFVVAEGDGFTERGVCYDVETNPTIAKSKTAYDGIVTNAAYNVNLTGLAFAKKYYARAYATGSDGTVYGEELTFTTLPIVPTLTTLAVPTASVTGNSASGGGNVTADGGAPVTARGICWSLVDPPSIANSKTTDGDGLGEFTSSLTGLLGNSTYYVRAYATNSAGTGYGPTVSFKTLVDLPKVTTTTVTGITKTSAISGGNATYDGGGTITAKGLVWSLDANPDLNDNVIPGGTGTGAFISNLTDLTLNTTYHVRAYATNSVGTAYGDDVSFKTLADITKLWVVGTYNEWSNSDAAEFIINTETSTEAQGYVYFPAAGAFKLATDHSWDDAHTFGDNGSGALTNPGGDISVPAGYLFIKANLVTMTYSVTPTVWGIIGDATPGAWASQTNMNYSESLKIFWLGATLTSGGSIKFLGTSTWSVNYGAVAGSNSLIFDGPNIPVSVDGDYAITLDLSHPNEYTYRADRWSIIGDATPGGWTNDTDMTWDAVNGCFTATLNLTEAAFKFRANHAWAYDFGGSLSALTPGGANISVAEAGNYTITLNPWTRVATMTKN